MIKLNNLVIEPTIFPDKTSQVWNIPEPVLNTDAFYHVIDWDFESEDELIHLHQLVSLLRCAYFRLPVILNISYLPYARQDKHVSNETTFALHSLGIILNSLRIDMINILDPHSHLGSLNNAHIISPFMHVKYAFDQFKPDYFCFPDTKARYRYSDVKEMLRPDLPTLNFNKVRNQATGDITHMEIIDSPSCVAEDKRVLIIDDICDGGWTFVLCADKLRKFGFKHIALYVTHGLFTKGFEALKTAGITEFYSKKGKHDV